MLSPNALRILDVLGVYERIRGKGFNFETLEFKTYDGETTDRYYFGSEESYGYKALRIYRQKLIDELLLLTKEKGVSVEYEKDFSHVSSESADQVSFEFADGSKSSASMLVGADGIHSLVRRHIHPSITTIFSGVLAVTSVVQRPNTRIPRDYHLPATILAKPGAFIIAPQAADDTELFFGTQRPYPDQNKAGWKKLLADKKELLCFLRKDLAEWPDVVQSILENVEADKITMWPFYMVPRLDRWTSDDHRVIILGDAAHAIPPTAGQGVNQAFEDVYMLAMLLSKVGGSITLAAALEFWYKYRQERVDRVLDLTKLMNAKRLPPAEQAKLQASEIWKGEGNVSDSGGQLRWLYVPNIDEHVSEWAQKMSTQ